MKNSGSGPLSSELASLASFFEAVGVSFSWITRPSPVNRDVSSRDHFGHQKFIQNSRDFRIIFCLMTPRPILGVMAFES
jgi:hypothetical protein